MRYLQPINQTQFLWLSYIHLQEKFTAATKVALQVVVSIPIFILLIGKIQVVELPAARTDVRINNQNQDMEEYYELLVKTLIPALGVLVVILGWSIQRKNDKIKIIQTQLTQLRTEAYSSVYSFFFEMLREVKNGKVNQSRREKELFKVKETILSFGSDEVFEKLSEWLRATSDEVTPIRILELTGELLVAIRKDMGYPNTKITSDDILLYLMQSSDEFDKLKSEYR